MSELQITYLPIGEIKPYENNPRHNDEAVQYVAKSIQEFGFKNPVILNSENVIIAGHTRIKAAEQLGIKEIPCIYASDLTEEQVKAFRLADNKVAEMAAWDFGKLEEELADIDIDMSEFGFEAIKEIEKEIDEVEYNEKISVVIDCENDEEAEEIYNTLMNEGYRCRISTL